VGHSEKDELCAPVASLADAPWERPGRMSEVNRRPIVHTMVGTRSWGSRKGAVA
jgi:hypothetical protein